MDINDQAPPSTTKYPVDRLHKYVQAFGTTASFERARGHSVQLGHLEWGCCSKALVGNSIQTLVSCALRGEAIGSFSWSSSHYSPASDASSEMEQQSSCQASSCHLWVVQDAIPEYPGISVWEFHCHGNDAHPCLDNNIHGDSSNDKIISNKATTTTILYYYYL